MSRRGAGRRGIWIDATIHAREWLATATHLKIMQHVKSLPVFSVCSDTVQFPRYRLFDVTNAREISWLGIAVIMPPPCIRRWRH